MRLAPASDQEDDEDDDDDQERIATLMQKPLLTAVRKVMNITISVYSMCADSCFLGSISFLQKLVLSWQREVLVAFYEDFIYCIMHSKLIHNAY